MGCRSTRVAAPAMRRFEESTGSLWGRVAAAFCPWHWCMCRLVCGVWLIWQLLVWWDLLTRYPMFLLQGPGQVSAACSAEKTLSVIILYCLIIVWMCLPLNFLPWLWFYTLCAWNRLGWIFLHYSWRSVASFLLFSILLAHNLFCCPNLSTKSCSVPCFIE